MPEYIRCCSVCGSALIHEYPKMILCSDCRRSNRVFSGETTVYISEHPKDHYENLSIEKYGTKDRWKDIFIETELSKTALFSRELYLASLEKQKERDKRIAEMKDNHVYVPPKNIPKCPTCQSTKIKKISATRKATHWFAFGFLSNTARSQFECENCGYKW